MPCQEEPPLDSGRGLASPRIAPAEPGPQTPSTEGVRLEGGATDLLPNMGRTTI